MPGSRITATGKYEKVGTKKPNPWGLYDMHGNVMEWTLDQYAPDSYAKCTGEDPWVKSTKPYPQAARGGSWNDSADRLTLRARAGVPTRPGRCRTRNCRRASGI